MLGGLRKPRLFLGSILCLPKAPGCQLLEAATSVGCRFLGSSQASNALDRLGTLQGFRFDVFGVKCLLWVKSGHLSVIGMFAMAQKRRPKEKCWAHQASNGSAIGHHRQPWLLALNNDPAHGALRPHESNFCAARSNKTNSCACPQCWPRHQRHREYDLPM